MTLFYLEFVNIGSLFLFSLLVVWTILFFSIRLSTYNLYSEKLFDRNVFDVRFYLVAILFIIKSSFKINKYYFCDNDTERGIFGNVNLPLSIDGGFLFLGLGGLILTSFFIIYGGEKPKPKPDNEDEDPDPFNFEGNLFGAIKLLIGPERDTKYDYLSQDRLAFSSELIKYARIYCLLDSKTYLQITGTLMNLDAAVLAFDLMGEGTTLDVAKINAVFYRLNKQFTDLEFRSNFKDSEVVLLKKIYASIIDQFPSLGQN
jgi:hypothetical protein